MGHLDPRLEREVRRRWEVRAAEWRAVAIAEAVFGGRVVPRLAGGPGVGFRALLELEVPFDDLDRHRDAEERFLAAAGRDELLADVPMLVLFAPRAREEVAP
jgi:hypothetical protein